MLRILARHSQTHSIHIKFAWFHCKVVWVKSKLTCLKIRRVIQRKHRADDEIKSYKKHFKIL